MRKRKNSLHTPYLKQQPTRPNSARAYLAWLQQQQSEPSDTAQPPPPHGYQAARRQRKWYQSSGFAVVMLILFFPVGLYLMWNHTGWKNPVKVLVTGLIALAALNLVLGGGSEPDSAVPPGNVSAHIAAPQTDSIASTPTPEPASSIIVPAVEPDPAVESVSIAGGSKPEEAPTVEASATTQSTPAQTAATDETGTGSSPGTGNNNFNTYEDTEAPAEAAYVGNSNTGKFHRPSCHHVNRINPTHIVAHPDRDHALGLGYEPCGTCNP